ncbi:MAG: MarR family winged helix-turn-helix transcriptional regulator [Christensenellales bacterium]|nr:MarR family winged helix-turn-helix transcriptional regulator [Christensenellales bacterium]
MDRFTFFRMLGEAVYRIDSAYDVFSKNAGIKANMLWLLSALNDGQTHTQSQICWDWNYPRTTVNTLVKELEQQGYVELIPVAGTRRELYIVLTDAGKAYADSILKPVYDAEEQLFERYSKEHGTDFVHQLNAFSNTMKTFFRTGNYEDRFESPDEEG